MKLTQQNLYETLKKFFRPCNDEYMATFHEELEELNDFNVTNVAELESLFKKHIKEINKIDTPPTNPNERKLFVEEFGEDFVRHRENNGFWYSFPALLRIMMELEFGETYEQYMIKKAKE